MDSAYQNLNWFRNILRNTRLPNDRYFKKATSYLNELCYLIPNRRTGSVGNRKATEFFAQIIKPWDYLIDTKSFHCLDYKVGGASLLRQNTSYKVYVSPFSVGCDVRGELAVVSSIEELERYSFTDKILLMKGDLCTEMLMPKNFVFYNPDHHKKIYSLLEEKSPKAIITATAKSPQLVGALYPFPMIADGDFDIPSVFCTDDTGDKIAQHSEEKFTLKIKAQRIPATAYNVIGRKNPDAPKKMTVTAHIDTWENTPGALDNASGIVVLLLLAEMLSGYQGNMGIEIAAFNGEDYYNAAGQMDYLSRYGRDLDNTSVAINIDDVGYIRGKTTFSLYQCPLTTERIADVVFGRYKGLVLGEPWFQGDHMIFVQKGIAAIAFTSDQVTELMANITHTPKDTPEIVDCLKLVELATALKEFIRNYK